MITFEGRDYDYEIFTCIDEDSYQQIRENQSATYLMGRVHFKHKNPLNIEYIEGLLKSVGSTESIMSYSDIKKGECIISSMTFWDIHKIRFKDEKEIFSNFNFLKKGALVNPINMSD